jgi:hypothetical protein
VACAACCPLLALRHAACANARSMAVLSMSLWAVVASGVCSFGSLFYYNLMVGLVALAKLKIVMQLE